MSSISKKDDEFRKEVKEGNLWRVIFKVCLPLALYSYLTQLFNVLDTIMASGISSSAVSTVVYMVQLQHIVLALGTGLAVGSAILISHAYGKGDSEEIKSINSTSLSITMLLSLVIASIIPFTASILRAARTPEIFIQEGTLYFSITLIGIIIQFYNTIYISNERCRGRSRKILFINLSAVAVKLALTALFVYVLKLDIVSIALASLISYLFIFAFAISSFKRKDDPFAFSIHYIKGFGLMKKILKLSFPSMVEKIAFSYGKASVNNMAANYGSDIVGAAGISNNMSGLLTGIQTGFQDGGVSIQGQLYGSGDLKRTIKAYRHMQLVIALIGLVGFFIMNILKSPIAYLFSISRTGYDENFHQIICDIFTYELLGCLLLSFAYASFSILLALGRTKTVLFINFARVFIFRLPVIYFFQTFTNLSYIAVGYTMAISNSSIGILAFILAELSIKSEKKAFYKKV